MRLSEAAKRMTGCSALGKRTEQQPGAKLTMARFTPPVLAHGGNQIFATGHRRLQALSGPDQPRHGGP